MFLLFLILMPFFANAQRLVPCATRANPEPCTLCDLIVGIDNIIGWGFRIVVFVALTLLVIGGIIYILSAGDESMITKAKTIIKQTLIGFVIVLGAWLIVNYSLILLSATGSVRGITPTKDWGKFECGDDIDLWLGSLVVPGTPEI